GQITVANAAALDFETNPSFTLTVQVQDAGGLTDTATMAISVIAAAPAGPAPPGNGTPAGSPSAPGSGPGSGDPVGPGSEVDDGNASKTGFERNITASDDSRVTTSASITRAPAVSSKALGSDKNFIDGSQGLGSKQPVAIETNAAAASATGVQDAKDPYSTLNVNLEELNRLRDNMNHQLSLETLALSLGLSVGYAIWLVRGGALLSSLLSSLPAWRWIDPLPVLAHLRDTRDDEEGNEDSLQAMLKNAKDRDQSKPVPDVEVVPPAQQAATGAALWQPDATASLHVKAELSV
ncbi:MAG: cadherin repeat domain-containing protein, partial [Gammaproteobacteria bacterium]